MLQKQWYIKLLIYDSWELFSCIVVFSSCIVEWIYNHVLFCIGQYIDMYYSSFALRTNRLDVLNKELLEYKKEIIIVGLNMDPPKEEIKN